jgi:pimeloyl-ACP methyl ester carboxylesterase
LTYGNLLRAYAAASVALLAGCAGTSTPGHATYPAGELFFVGGNYVAKGQDTEYLGQMYVQRFSPATKRFAYPIVLVHGSGQTGNNFLGTPDGRPGWVKYFVDRGFDTLVVDQPARARSNTAASYGPYTRFPISTIQYLASIAPFPQAKLANQFPGGAPRPGNPAFDQFIASQVEFLADGSATERLNAAALVALLEKIGPAVLVTHSQAGSFGWLVTDARPELVKAHVAIEPNGPPFRDVSFVAGDPWYQFRPGVARANGIAREKPTFQPPLGSGEELSSALESRTDFKDGTACYLQPEPARKLPRLADVPTAIVTGEASFRATYDHCMSKFLSQAGVKNTHLRLEDKGIKGNSGGLNPSMQHFKDESRC